MTSDSEHMGAANGRRIRILLFVIALASTACRPARIVSVAWDAPGNLPDRYWIRVDDSTVLDISPPPVDPVCSCLTVHVPVPRGRHTVSVVAYDRKAGPSPPSASVIVQ